jgi:hypothetical protein
VKNLKYAIKNATRRVSAATGKCEVIICKISKESNQQFGRGQNLESPAKKQSPVLRKLNLTTLIYA